MNTDVPGLSDNVVKMPNARKNKQYRFAELGGISTWNQPKISAVGPNASKDTEYKNPEYFCYHVDSFGEAEVELAKYRLPVPSNKRSFNK